MDLFTTRYKRWLFLGGFNVGMEDSSIKIFCSNYNLTSMISKPNYYKNRGKHTCIDLTLRDCTGSCVIETWLSDFHTMIATVMKISYRKIEPRVINFRDYTSFTNERFRKSLSENLNVKLSENFDKSFSKDILENVLQKNNSENDEIIKTEKRNCKSFNNFFSNIAQNLDIWGWKTNFRKLFRYQNHPSIVAI